MTSVSTLFREARRTKDPKKAAALRKQAAEMRGTRKVRKVSRMSEAQLTRLAKRADRKRGKKGNGHDPRVAQLLAKREKSLREQEAERASYHYERSRPMQPGEISDSQLEIIFDRARKYRHDAGGMVRQQMALAVQEERRTLDTKHKDQLNTMREINLINVVCAFIADMEGTAALNGGALPPSVMVSGFTVARLIEALRNGGYSAEGKRGDARAGITKNTA